MSEIRKMRAIALLLGCLLLTGIFAGCGKKEETPADTVNVYYINKEETKITAVEKEPEGDTLSKQAEWGISQLKENPVELSLRSPISGFAINSWNVKDDQLVLDMSVEYKKLSPSSEVLVRAAIVRTMTQLEGISYVSVTVGGEALTDSLGNVVGPMTADLFIDNAGNEINAYEKTRLLLYFTNESGERLIGVQTKPVVYSSNISMEKLVVERLIAGPDAENEELYPVINPATKVLGVTVKDGTEYKKLSPSSEVLVRAAIVRTMTQLEGISYVSVTVGGEALTDSLGNVVGPMTADLFIDNAGNEINAYEKTRLLLYFTNESGERLIGVQTKPVVYSSNISMEKLVVERLIAGPDAENEELYPVINPATKVLGVTVKDGTCYVNLDNGFLTQTYNVSAEVQIYSIVNSLVELSNINKVQIAVNGNTDMIFREKISLSNVFDRNLDLVYETEELQS